MKKSVRQVALSQADIISVGRQEFKRNKLFEKSGHFYETFYKNEIQKFYDFPGTIWEHLRIFRHFKARYASIDDWFQDELVSRVGRESVDPEKSFETRLSYRSRWYIYYLCIFGLRLDYPYLFSIRSVCGFTKTSKRYGLDYGMPDLDRALKKLKYEYASFSVVRWVVNRIIMHTGKKHYTEITLDDIAEFEEESHKYCLNEHLSQFWAHAAHMNVHKRVRSALYQLHLVLYTSGIVSQEPKRHYTRDDFVCRDLSHLKYDKISKIITKYVQQISLTKERSTVDKSFKTLNKFSLWLESEYPTIDNFRLITRSIVDHFLDHIQKYVSNRTGRQNSTSYLSNIISNLKIFFDETLYFGYEDVPQHKLLYNYHLPRRQKTLPRYIPEQDLEKLMEAIRNLECPYQKNALILLRWTGARREEIRRLDINALDYYPDGTPKLFIPLGKTNTCRWVPIQKEAESAFKELLEIRKSAGNLKGLTDRKTGKITDYLFMKKNHLISGIFLFDSSMRRACKNANLLTGEGKHKYTSHQFRHTMGSQMANRGASLSTIMKMLGHLSPDMTVRYAHIHDETVKLDYQKTIDRDVVIAGGEYAEHIKQQTLLQEEVDWIKTNFHKTYLMMGHCFHHTREPMCDFADACYFCPKFVTTRDHLPRLIEKHEIELQLIQDAQERGWKKEIDRHTNVAQRVKQIIQDLDEGRPSVSSPDGCSHNVY